ncbi:MAG: NAD(P)H-dependent oxidoreductase subunit E, partial [Firmicutes bacterium]|nr:NAD(P)H-dependent oxidoreductase subunit E [Bacillota bacterium]
MPRINSAAELEALRKDIQANKDPLKPCVSICAGIACLGLGNGKVIDAFKDELQKQALTDKVELRVTGCHGFCEKGPLVVVYPEEICYTEVTPADVPEIVAKTVMGKQVIERLIYTDPATGDKAARQSEIPFYKNQMRLLLGNSQKINPQSIDDYLAIGGYAALAKALLTMKPEEILQEIKTANLRG